MHVTLDKLPHELVRKIVRDFSRKDLINSFLVSQAFYKIMTTDTVLTHFMGSWNSVQEISKKTGYPLHKSCKVAASIFGFVTYTPPPRATTPSLLATAHKSICVAESNTREMYLFNPKCKDFRVKRYGTPFYFMDTLTPTHPFTLHNHLRVNIFDLEKCAITRTKRLISEYTIYPKKHEVMTVHSKHIIVRASFDYGSKLLVWDISKNTVGHFPHASAISAIEFYDERFFFDEVDIRNPIRCQKLCFQTNYLYTILSRSQEISPISVFDIANDSIKLHATIPCPQLSSRWVSFCPSELFHAGVTSSGRGYLLEAKTYTVSAEIPLGFLSPVDKAKTWIEGESVFFTDYKVIKVYDSRRPKQPLLSIRPIAPAKSFTHITDPNPHGYAALDNIGNIYNFSNKPLETYWTKL